MNFSIRRLARTTRSHVDLQGPRETGVARQDLTASSSNFWRRRRRSFGSSSAGGARNWHGLRIMTGMIVLEVGNVLAAPSVGQFLRELGATVIKVESPVTNGDVTRTWRLASEKNNGSDVTAYFSSCNLGKMSLSVDLTKPEGKEIIHSLASIADCFIASFKPGDAEKLNVDDRTIRALNDRLIYAQITGYGLQDSRVGYDAVIQAESGFQFMNGPPDPHGEPCKMPVALVDVITAHQLKEAVLVELWRREITGKGASVNVSLLASAVSALVNQAMGYLKEGAIPKRMGSEHPSIAPYGTIFATANSDEQITLGVGSDSQFRSLCKVLGLEDLADKESKFAHNPGRCEHRAELRDILADKIQQWQRKDLLATLQKESVPCGAINNMKDVFEQDQAKELVVNDEEHGKPIGIRQIAFKGNIEGIDSENDPAFLKPPSYGEHTDQILGQVLGYDENKLKILREKGIIV